MMSVKFVWRGNDKIEGGIAVYTSNDTSFEMYFDSFKKANELHKNMQNIFAEGRRAGHHEMMQSVNRALDETSRKL